MGGRRIDVEGRDPQWANGRARYRLDAQLCAILDAEIAKTKTSGPMVELSRPQALRVLVTRAACCKCDAERRELEPVAVSAVEAKRRWNVDADAFVTGVVATEGPKLEEKGVRARLRPHQILRTLLMRAARCRCHEGGPRAV
jgi:hypothetical protein